MGKKSRDAAAAVDEPKQGKKPKAAKPDAPPEVVIAVSYAGRAWRGWIHTSHVHWVMAWGVATAEGALPASRIVLGTSTFPDQQHCQCYINQTLN